MPSPFPGMDPYLEAPYIWPDFHNALAGEIRNRLNLTLPAPYYARLEMRPEVGITDETGEPRSSRRIVPDLSVVEPPRRQTEGGGVAVLDAARTTISPSIEVDTPSEEIPHRFVEVRDPSQGHRLVTLIEILSPTNKRPGPERRTYVQKFNEIYDSDANLVEIDLLRGGERIWHDTFSFRLFEGGQFVP